MKTVITCMQIIIWARQLLTEHNPKYLDIRDSLIQRMIVGSSNKANFATYL
jgi:hypothetical protein